MGVGPAVVAFLVALTQGAFSETWEVTLPPSVLSVSRSCVTVPCSFRVPRDHEANVLSCGQNGQWRRGDFTGPIVKQGRIVGNLTRKDCTTVFSHLATEESGTYLFRLDCPNSLKFTFKNGVNITVLPDPPPPEMSSASETPEGAQVRLQCSVPVLCSDTPPSLTWLESSGKEETRMAQGADGRRVMTSTLSFVASADHHNQSVACSVTYPLSGGASSGPAARSRRLSILFAPRFTTATIGARGPVSAGRAVTFACSSDANPPVSRFLWFREDDGALTQIGRGATLVLQVQLEDAGSYLCEARNVRGSQRSRPVSLEVAAAGGRGEQAAVPYVICGVMAFLFILTVVVDLYKYKSLSRRLKQIELKEENAYTDLRICSVAADYDQLQSRQPKTKPCAGAANAATRDPPASRPQPRWT